MGAKELRAECGILICGTRENEAGLCNQSTLATENYKKPPFVIKTQ